MVKESCPSSLELPAQGCKSESPHFQKFRVLASAPAATKVVIDIGTHTIWFSAVGSC